MTSLRYTSHHDIMIRYAHVYNLIESEPEVKSWASSLASDLTNNHYVIVPNVLGEEKSRQLRAEVRLQ